MISKLKEIAGSWWRAANPTKEQSDLAKLRLRICKECPSMVESAAFGYKCGECGCPIGKKIFTDRYGGCPLSKWNDVDELYKHILK
jgi:hypothetical protein